MVMEVVPVKCEPYMVTVDPTAPTAGEKDKIEANTELSLEGVFFLQEKNEKKQIERNKIENFIFISLKI